jgi:Mg/Co/Ni transporter MgtE
LGLIAKIKEEFPDYDESSYKQSFMRATQEEINSGKTDQERKQILEEIRQADLLEIQKSGTSSDFKTVKNMVNENYTHNTLLSELKAKSDILNRLEEVERRKLEKETQELPPDVLIEELKDVPKTQYVEKLIEYTIDNTMNRLIKENPS